jgi:hypothetical protein
MDTNESLEFVGPKDVRALLERPSSTTVSIFHPTKRVAVEPEENSLHLKNLLREATRALEDRSLRGPDIKKLLEPATGLLDDEDFWRHQMEGLAIFLDDQGMTHFRLPEEVPADVVVGTSPYVEPLLGSVFPNTRFYLLALSQNDLRLLHCSRDRAQQIDLSRYDIPTSLEESLRYDNVDEPDSKHHPTTGPGRGPVGEPTGERERRHAFHGHGESGEDHKTQVRGHFLSVGKVLDKVLGQEHVPLILAGVEWIQAMYRDVSSYEPILDSYVDGNPDGSSPEELHGKARTIIDGYRRGQIDAWKEAFGAYLAKGTGSTELRDILVAAQEGRVARVFLRRGAQLWGTFDAADQSVRLEDRDSPGAVDLYDLAARQVILTDGEVIVLDGEDVPADGDVAAMFRW